MFSDFGFVFFKSIDFVGFCLFDDPIPFGVIDSQNPNFDGCAWVFLCHPQLFVLFRYVKQFTDFVWFDTTIYRQVDLAFGQRRFAARLLIPGFQIQFGY